MHDRVSFEKSFNLTASHYSCGHPQGFKAELTNPSIVRAGRLHVGFVGGFKV